MNENKYYVPYLPKTQILHFMSHLSLRLLLLLTIK